MKSILTLFIVLTASVFASTFDATVISYDKIDKSIGGEVFLCDAASIYGPDRYLVARLSSIYLCDAPESGSAQMIYRADIKRRIAAAGIDPQRVEMRGSLETVVVSADELPEGNPFAGIVKSFLENHFSRTGEMFKLEFRHLPDIKKPYNQEAKFRVIESRSQRYKGNIVIIIGEEVNNRVEHKYPVSVEVRTFAQVLVAVKSVGKRAPLEPGDFVLDRRETTNLRESPISDLTRLTGKRAARSIPRGSILTMEEIEAAPVIEQGDIVNIIVNRGSFTVCVTGRARKSGGIGELIPVINLSSHKEVTARVLDANTVVVEY